MQNSAADHKTFRHKTLDGWMILMQGRSGNCRQLFRQLVLPSLIFVRCVEFQIIAAGLIFLLCEVIFFHRIPRVNIPV